MNLLLEGQMSFAMVDLTRAKSSGTPVRTHVVDQRKPVEINYEGIRRMLHKDDVKENATNGDKSG